MLDILLDPERRQKAVEDQAKARAKFGHRIITDPAQSRYFVGQAREQSILAALEGVTAEDQKTHWVNQLAEAYAMQGRFTEAAEVVQSPAHKAEYEAKADAVANIGQRCDCSDTIHFPLPNDAKGRIEPSQTEVIRIFDGTKTIIFRRCAYCKTISAHHA